MALRPFSLRALQDLSLSKNVYVEQPFGAVHPIGDLMASELEIFQLVCQLVEEPIESQLDTGSDASDAFRARFDGAKRMALSKSNWRNCEGFARLVPATSITEEDRYPFDNAFQKPTDYVESGYKLIIDRDSNRELDKISDWYEERYQTYVYAERQDLILSPLKNLDMTYIKFVADEHLPQLAADLIAYDIAIKAMTYILEKPQLLATRIREYEAMQRDIPKFESRTRSISLYDDYDPLGYDDIGWDWNEGPRIWPR